MQVLVQKIGEVARIKQAEQSASNNRQQDFINGITQDTVKYSKTVNQTLPGEKKIVNDNEEKDRRRKRKEEKKEEDKKDDKKDCRLTEKGSNIDIKI